MMGSGLRDEKNKKVLCLKMLLGDPAMTTALATFIEDSHHFNTQKAK
jgi:hypothetical protein